MLNHINTASYCQELEVDSEFTGKVDRNLLQAVID